MIFSELHSAYFTAVRKILTRAIEGNLTEEEMKQIVRAHAFSESALTVLPALRQQKWPLLLPDLTTPIRLAPEMPITRLEKQWLKAILLDPRIRLFGIRVDGLSDVEPLFTPEDYYVYDRYADGDPYGDESYIMTFGLILRAIREHFPLQIETLDRRGKVYFKRVMPQKLEYSEKDDKFRLITTGCRFGKVINLGRIVSCRRYYGNKIEDTPLPPPSMQTVTLLVTDERNAPERVMLHFAHFEKQTERIDRHHYRLQIKYDSDDETELVIRVLAFGPLVRVEAPGRFVELIRERLRRQMRLGLR